tara:strand:- start:102 stop:2063 length:1962 start_codon:yes stop_codon:yes gene_type:complete
MIVLFFLILLIFSNTYSIDIEDSNFNSNLQIVPEKNIFIHNDNYYFGVKIMLNNGWKTYWKNPGDAGSAIKLNFQNMQNILAYEILYPMPKFYTDHGVKTIGYENEIIFPVELKIKDENKKISADINIEYLICKEICIPINIKKKINFKSEKKNTSDKNFEILKYLEKVPQTDRGFFNFEDSFAKDDHVFYTILDNPQKKKFEIYPFSSEANISLQDVELGTKTKIYFESDESLKNLKNPVEISISDGKNVESVLLNLSNLTVKENIIKFLILAFVGGIILNFMPCVFPVLSLKVMSMIQFKQFEKLKIKKISFFIIMGIIFSFIILSQILITLKYFGITVGWGFQFQNTYFLVFLSLIILLFSLNLLGFFEIILPNSLINYFGRLERKESYSGYFFSGMFATLMATPCSAPFLGTAIGFASLTSNLNIFLIFLFISIGFSIPYFLIIFQPSILYLLPKPGKWMISFKYFLGIILLITFFWLLSVMQVNILINLSLFTLIIFFSIFHKKMDKKISLSIIFSFLVCAFFFFLYFGKKENLVWEKFNENLIHNYIDKNNLIFVDFTADWCVTCKFNKFTTLQNQNVIEYFLENDVKLIRGDWTKKDEKILKFIKKYERFGVPVNIIYSENMKDGFVLPEILSKSIVIDNFERIKK